MSKKKEKANETHSKRNDQDSMAAGSEPLDAEAASGGSSNSGGQGTEAGEEKLEKRLEELTGDLQRVQAEFINYKRREAEVKAEMMNLAKQEVVEKLLPLLDNLDRALTHRPDELKDNAWASGVSRSVSRQWKL